MEDILLESSNFYQQQIWKKKKKDRKSHLFSHKGNFSWKPIDANTHVWYFMCIFYILFAEKIHIEHQGQIPHGVVAKVLDYSVVVNEFDHQNRYYVHFRTNTLGKGMNPLILLAIGFIESLLFIYKDDFGIKWH